MIVLNNKLFAMPLFISRSIFVFVQVDFQSAALIKSARFV